MCHSLLPATKPPKQICRLGWNRTAFAPLSAEQFHLRSLPGHWLARGRWSEPDRGFADLPDRRLRDKSGAGIPKTGEVCFTSQLHLVQGDKLHRLEVANCGKRNEINAERPRSRNAAKTSDEAGATRLFDARCVTGCRVAPASSILRMHEQIIELATAITRSSLHFCVQAW